MDRLASSQFRKTYATLTEPTTVTVHGHVIGEWVPVRHARYQTIQEVKAMIADVQKSAAEVMAGSAGVGPEYGVADSDGPGFGRSRPAPKPKR